MSHDIDRLIALVCRELGASEARVLATGETAEEGPSVVQCRLADGRGIWARFDAPPADLEAKQRRLEILASTFDTVVEEASTGRASRPPHRSSLHEELLALITRASAVNAIVIDANSPVVWGAAHPDGVIAQPPLASSPRVAEPPANDEGLGESSPAVLSRHAIYAVRAWPELSALRKGKHIRRVEREGMRVLAHSFGSIYLLLLVFDADFDELRAERAVVEALSRIERLVMALPPLDPDPTVGAGAIAVKRPRRP